MEVGEGAQLGVTGQTRGFFGGDGGRGHSAGFVALDSSSPPLGHGVSDRGDSGRGKGRWPPQCPLCAAREAAGRAGIALAPRERGEGTRGSVPGEGGERSL